MANDLTKVTPQLLAQGLLALREVAFMPRLVNRGYESLAGQKGSTIDVPIPSAIAAQDVTPANVPPDTADVAPTSVSITMDNWKEAPFYLTDKDLLTCMNGTIPMQASEAVKSLANVINTDILAKYKSFYGAAGTAGTTPFATDIKAATNARKLLNKQLAPAGADRRMILDPDATANALGLDSISNQVWRNNQAAIIEGQISRTMGFDWFEHQLVPSHTKGTAATITLTSTSPVGSTSVGLKATSGTLVQGDIITFAGDTQQYVVVDATVTLSAVQQTVNIYPKLKVAQDGSGTAVVVTLLNSHVANIAFHRDAIAFASRPLENVEPGLGAITSSMVDADSGLTLRLEVTREHKRTRYSYDILWGSKVVRPEFGVRVLG